MNDTYSFYKTIICKMKKFIIKHLTKSILLFNVFALIAQEPVVVEPSPETAALAKYIDRPISLFSGTPNINIPLYTIVDGDITVPISLSYHSSGIKVNEDASWVGLGWVLNAGGEIIREQRGNYDYESHSYASMSRLPTGNWNFNNAHIDHVSTSDCYYYSEEPPLETGQTECELWQDPQWKGEPDLYMFSLPNGRSGKFVIKRNPNGRGNVSPSYEIIDRQPIEIHKTSSTGYILFTPDGLHYNFNDSSCEDNATSNGLDGSTQVNNYDGYCDALHLTKIDNRKGREVTFEYKPRSYIYHTPIVRFAKADLKNVIVDDDRNDYGTAYYSITYGKYLQYIRFSNGYVEFVSNPRNDVHGGLKLETIKVYQNGNTDPIKTISFDYGYFEGVEDYGNFYQSNNGIGGDINTSIYTDDVLSKRLKLLSVTVDDKIYNFDYNEDKPLPYKTSMAMDYWGYFNGKANSYSKTLLPNGTSLRKYYNIPSEFENFVGVNRESDEDFAKAGILKKISYPTGGTTTYEFELNEFDNRKNDSYTTYEKVEIRDCEDSTYDNKEYIHDFAYQYDLSFDVWIHSPGVNNSNECFVSVDRYSETSGGWISSIWDLKNYQDECTNYVYDDECSPVENVGGVQYYDLNIKNIELSLEPGKYRFRAKYPIDKGKSGDPAHRAEIIFKLPTLKKVGTLRGGGLRIKSIKHESTQQPKLTKTYTYSGGHCYQMPNHTKVLDGYSNLSRCHPITGAADLPNIPDGCHSTGLSPKGAILYSSSIFSYSNSANGSPVGYSKVTEQFESNDAGKTEYFYTMGDAIHAFRDVTLPGTPSNNDLNIGLLEGEIDYRYDKIDSIFLPVRKIKNKFEPFNKMVTWGVKRENEYVLFSCNGFQVKSNIYACGSQRLNLYPIRFADYRLTESEQIAYLDNGKAVKTTETFGYNNKGFKNHITFENSNGKTIETKMVYPSDIGSPLWNAMNGNNVIKNPIEVVKYVDGNAIEGTYTEYDRVANSFLPEEIYKLKKSDTDNFVSILENSGTRSDLFYKIQDISYNDNGNVIEYHKENNESVYYIWGYRGQYPIIKIESSSSVIDNAFLQELIDDHDFTGSQVKADIDADIAFIKSSIADIGTMVTKSDMVSIYTYAPLIGKTSETAPNGLTTYYEYDSSGRLEFIKDNDGNILKQYDYHYAE